MLKLLFVLPPLMVLALLPHAASAPHAQAAFFAQAAAPEPAAPAAPDVPQNNPVTATPDSQAQASATYKIDCAMCHGEGGNGKGDLVADMGLTMKDMRDPATLKNMPDRDLYPIIRDGKNKMPPEGDRVKPDEIWNLVILVRGFAKK